MEIIFTILPIYFFIFLGFFAKKILKDALDEKTLVLLSLYFFQPILIFWGLSKAPINFEFLILPIFFFFILLISLCLVIFICKYTFKSNSDKSIYQGISLVGNTGNLGIVFGIAFFGVDSVPYTSIINIANTFFMYTFGVYFFAREHYSLKESFFSILKIPAIWFTFPALFFSYLNINFTSNIQIALDMGAYTSLTLQLFIFGAYISNVRLSNVPWKLSFNISLIKHVILPLIGVLLILLFSTFNIFIVSIIIMQLCMPLAVNNINFAVLYNCKYLDVASSILFSAFVFSFLVYFYIYLINIFIK